MDFSDLHPKQKNIVEYGDGIVIVNAGPGTGKTKTLTSRVAYLINNKGVDPQNILTLTFTNRAAGEMRMRLTPQVKVLPLITTFHGFCYDLLKQWGEEFEIISDEERAEIIKKIIKEQKTKLSPRDFSKLISLAKNAVSDDLPASELGSLINLYNQELAMQNKFDFDDLLSKVFATLRHDETKRSIWQKRFHHILIDEFQDSNKLQYELVKLILPKKLNLFVIGDPLQSIYGFRGASPDIFNRLKTDFTDTKEEKLEINYRSYQKIVRICNNLFPVKVSAQSFSIIPGHVEIIETLNEYSEADWVINHISETIGGVELLTAKDDGHQAIIDFSDFAIIYRTHATARVLEKKLQESGFPYQIVKEDTQLEGHHIKLMSMHAAKGLEFKYVVICGFEEGLIPHRRYEDVEEEKRLLYVALTRAKQELYLLYARKRNKKNAQLSSFYKLLNINYFVKTVDPAIKKIIKKQELYSIKKSQGVLF